MTDDSVSGQELSKAFEYAFHGNAQAAAQNPCSTYRRVPQHLKDEFGQLIEKYIGGFGTQFYKLLLSIADEHCGTG
jgi:hypothetical protein